MKSELAHEPAGGPRPCRRRARLAGRLIQDGGTPRAAAEAARPAFAAALREAWRA